MSDWTPPEAQGWSPPEAGGIAVAAPPKPKAFVPPEAALAQPHALSQDEITKNFSPENTADPYHIGAGVAPVGDPEHTTQSAGQDIKNLPGYLLGRAKKSASGVSKLAFSLANTKEPDIDADLNALGESGSAQMAANPVQRRLIRQPAETGVDLAAIAAGSVAGPVGAGVVMGAQTGGDVYTNVREAAKEKGLSDEDADHLASLAGTGGAVVGGLGGGLFSGPSGMAEKGIEGVARSAIGGAVGSAVTNPSISAIESAATGAPMPSARDVTQGIVTGAGVNALIHGVTRTVPELLQRQQPPEFIPAEAKPASTIQQSLTVRPTDQTGQAPDFIPAEAKSPAPVARTAMEAPTVDLRPVTDSGAPRSQPQSESVVQTARTTEIPVQENGPPPEFIPATLESRQSGEFAPIEKSTPRPDIQAEPRVAQQPEPPLAQPQQPAPPVARFVETEGDNAARNTPVVSPQSSPDSTTNFIPPEARNEVADKSQIEQQIVAIDHKLKLESGNAANNLTIARLNQERAKLDAKLNPPGAAPMYDPPESSVAPVEQAGKPKKPAGTFSKAGLEKYLVDRHGELSGDALQNELDTEDMLTNGGTTFRKIPAEVHERIRNRPDLLKLLTETDQTHGVGEDTVSKLGADRYVKMLEGVGAKKGERVDAAKEFAARHANIDPELAFRSALHDAITTHEGEKPTLQKVDPAKLPTGSKFEIMGHKVEVIDEGNGYRILRDGDEFPDTPVEALSTVPVDKGSVTKGKKRGEGEVYGEGGSGRTGTAGAPEERPSRDNNPIAKALKNKGGFIGDDVIPTAREAAKSIIQAKTDIQSVLGPQTRSAQARTEGNLLREVGATIAQRYDRAEAALADARKFFHKQTPEQNFKFYDDVENGRPTGNPATDAIAKQLRELLDSRRKEVQSLGKGKLNQFIANYLPHIWKDPEKATSIFAQFLGKRPIEGPKSFLKKRSIPTLKEGMEKGLEPISDNPIDQTLLKIREMDRYILAQRHLQEMKTRGLAKFVRATDRAPEGYAKLDDRVAEVYGPPTIKVNEYVDRVLYEGMTKLADDLGIIHERKFNTGRGKLGVSYQGADRIETQYATGERVLAHEIGHQLDYKYGLFDKLFNNKDDKLRPQLKQELRKLADAKQATLENQAGRKTTYTRKRVEQVAHILEAYINNRPQFDRIAPNVRNVFESVINAHPELEQIRKIQRSLGKQEIENEVPHGGLLKFGQYYAPEPVANVFNNYLSPGLRGKGWYRAWTGAGNVLNQAQLGLSAFHLGFTSLDAATSKFALGIEQGLRGHPVQAIKSFAKTPFSPFTNFLRGDKILKEWYSPGSQGEAIATMADAVRRAGGRVRTDTVYRTDAMQAMQDAFRKGNVLGGLIRIPGGLLDAAAKPILEYIVPRQKLGVFADMAKNELARLGPDAKADDVRASLAKAWDSADNRMGQVVYDNLFWNKAAKDLAMASVRSLGWNLGTWRELGGGFIDFGKAGANVLRGRTPEMTHRMAYTIALPVLVGLVGGTMHYAMTGEKPDELKDYYFPKTGGLDENGRESRVSLPSYMKDIFALKEHPGKTMADKLHPLISTLADMWMNKDYFNTKIRNEDDPVMKQALDTIKFGAKQFTPFGIRGMMQAKERGQSAAKQSASFVGITPAPSFINQTDAEKMASKFMEAKAPIGSRTQAETDRSKLKNQLANQIHNGDQSARQRAVQAVRDGKLRRDDMTDIYRNSQRTTLMRQMEHLDAEDAMRVLDVATAEERKQVLPAVRMKIIRSQSLTIERRRELLGKLNETAKLKAAG